MLPLLTVPSTTGLADLLDPWHAFWRILAWPFLNLIPECLVKKCIQMKKKKRIKRIDCEGLTIYSEITGCIPDPNEVLAASTTLSPGQLSILSFSKLPTKDPFCLKSVGIVVPPSFCRLRCCFCLDGMKAYTYTGTLQMRSDTSALKDKRHR